MIKFNFLELIIFYKWNNYKLFLNKNNLFHNFVFYDGPPFANGYPHYGHLLTSFLKDIFFKYKAIMRFSITTILGWDCHGLPAELYTEQKIKIYNKHSISFYSIFKFNYFSTLFINKCIICWQPFFYHQNKFINNIFNYKTMYIGYMESIIWIFKKLYLYKLIYSSKKVMPFSWMCQTPVSDFETKIDNSYRKITSLSITVAFSLKHHFINNHNIFLLTWTTTPWTLISNLAIAINNKINYIIVKHECNFFIISNSLLFNYYKEIGSCIVCEINSSHLIDIYYNPIYDYFIKNDNSFKIINSCFVNNDHGTGLVHLAPGFGIDDNILCCYNNIHPVCPIDDSGKFFNSIFLYKGKFFYQCNLEIINYLYKKNLCVKIEDYFHYYPHCWRTDTPLIYKSVDSWYININYIKKFLLVNNNYINWIPYNAKTGLFGKWLLNARDWSISRNRFWGCPLPIWISDNIKYPCLKIYGSIFELENFFNIKINNLHRPIIDSLTKINSQDPKSISILQRINSVFDCWFESATMPYSSIHYPFNFSFSLHVFFPADLIIEYLSQTRGWFYTLLVISTSLFNHPPFLNCICHGVLINDYGQKISKRLKNYINLNSFFYIYGADSVRWFMLSSNVIKGIDLTISNHSSLYLKSVFLLSSFCNTYDFFYKYFNLDSCFIKFHFISNFLLDRYIFFKYFFLIYDIRFLFNNSNISEILNYIDNFINLFNNFYIRRSRNRLWYNFSHFIPSKRNAYNVIFSIISIIPRVIFPFIPNFSEYIFCKFNPYLDTIYIKKFPFLLNYLYNYFIAIISINFSKKICKLILNLRFKHNFRVRQIMKKIILFGFYFCGYIFEIIPLIIREVNVFLHTIFSFIYIKQYLFFILKIDISRLILFFSYPDLIYIFILFNLNYFVLISTIFTLNSKISNFYNILLFLKKKVIDISCFSNISKFLILLDLSCNFIIVMNSIIKDILRIVQNLRKLLNYHSSNYIMLIFSTNNKLIKQSILYNSSYIKQETLSYKLEVYNNYSYLSKNIFFIESGLMSIYII